VTSGGGRNAECGLGIEEPASTRNQKPGTRNFFLQPFNIPTFQPSNLSTFNLPLPLNLPHFVLGIITRRRL
jgi:hypothetical protein